MPARKCLNVRFWLPPQPIDATQALNLTAGVSNPNRRHSLADVRYRADFVRLAPESRRDSGRSRESEVDPIETLFSVVRALVE